MDKLFAIILIILFIPATAFAAEPDGWSPWLLIAEAGVGAGFGGALALITSLVMNFAIAGDNSDATLYTALIGDALGATAGTLFIGEVFGARSENKEATYLGTTLSSVGTAILFMLPFALEDSEAYTSETTTAEIIGYAGLGGIPIMTAVMYNVLKKPKIESGTSLDTGFRFDPTVGYLADRNGEITPTFGISVSF